MRVVWQKGGRVLDSLLREKDYAELLQGSVITFLLRCLAFALVYVLYFVIAKYFGAEALGNFSLSLTLLDIGLILVLLGLDTATVRFFSQYSAEEEREKARLIFYRILRYVVPFSVLCGVVLWLGADSLADTFYHDDRLIRDFHIIALLLPFSTVTRLFASAFRGLKKIRESLLFDVVGVRVGNLLLLLGLVWCFGRKTELILYSLAIAYVINTLLSWWVWRRLSPKKEKASGHAGMGSAEPFIGSGENDGSFSKNEREQNHTVAEVAATPKTPIQAIAPSSFPDDKMAAHLPPRSKKRIPYIQEIISTSLPMYLTASMYLVLGWTDTIMLGLFKSADVVGVYSIVLKLSNLISFVFISVNTILLPKFSELYWNGQQERLRKVVEYSTKGMFWSSVPLVCLLAALAHPLLGIFGSDFEAGQLPLLILCVGQFVNSLTGSVIALLNMTGHQKQSRNALLVASALNIAGNWLLVPTLGMAGASIATAASTMTRDLLASYYSYQIFGFRTWYIPYGKAVARLKKRRGVAVMREFPHLWGEREGMRDIREQAQKPWSREEFWAFYVLRPFSIYWSVFLARKTKVSPNVITWVSILSSCLSAASFLLGSAVSVLLGCVLYQFSYFLDCVDGEVARLTKKESGWGVWLDNGLHYTYYVVYFAAVYGVLQHTHLNQNYSIYLVLFTIAVELFASSGFELAFPSHTEEKAVTVMRKNNRWVDGAVCVLFSYSGFQLGVLLGAVVWALTGNMASLLVWTVYSIFMTLLKALYRVRVNWKSIAQKQARGAGGVK